MISISSSNCPVRKATSRAHRENRDAPHEDATMRPQHEARPGDHGALDVQGHAVNMQTAAATMLGTTAQASRRRPAQGSNGDDRSSHPLPHPRQLRGRLLKPAAAAAAPE